jgi:hypothetical protein
MREDWRWKKEWTRRDRGNKGYGGKAMRVKHWGAWGDAAELGRGLEE